LPASSLGSARRSRTLAPSPSASRRPPIRSSTSSSRGAWPSMP
jgi:hypothetical protein